jgi:outer membrane protein OmpA-like peptidoglycan-associated protein
MMDGTINRQGSSYRQGLVLGLTMAEIMLLLIFCLLIAMATFLKSEHGKLEEAKNALEQQQALNRQDQAIVDALRQNPALFDKISNAVGGDANEIDEFWRDLVASKAAMADLKKDGTSLKELREKAANMTTLQSNGIDLEKALRDAEITAAVKRAMPASAKSNPSPQEIADLIAKGANPGAGTAGHQWPPIITLSEAGGFYFKTGSAELSPPFRTALLTTTPEDIYKYIKQYDVDVIEVVGHTDEQAFGGRPLAPIAPIADASSPTPIIPLRQSNLDRWLPTVLRDGGDIAKLTPVDNAGLGLARAVSVVSVLRQSPKLANFKMIPLSGAQLVNTDETLAISKTPGGDVAQRRRIEIRLRKSVPHEAVPSILPATAVAVPSPAPRPLRPKVGPVRILPASQATQNGVAPR